MLKQLVVPARAYHTFLITENLFQFSVHLGPHLQKWKRISILLNEYILNTSIVELDSFEGEMTENHTLHPTQLQDLKNIF